MITDERIKHIVNCYKLGDVTGFRHYTSTIVAWEDFCNGVMSNTVFDPSIPYNHKMVKEVYRIFCSKNFIYQLHSESGYWFLRVTIYENDRKFFFECIKELDSKFKELNMVENLILHALGTSRASTSNTLSVKIANTNNRRNITSKLNPLNVVDDLVIFKNYNLNYDLLHIPSFNEKIEKAGAELKTRQGLLYKLNRLKKKAKT